MLFLFQLLAASLGMLFSIASLLDIMSRAARLARSGRNGATWVLVTHDTIAEVVRCLLHIYIGGFAGYVVFRVGLRPVPLGFWITAFPPLLILGLSFNSWMLRRQFDRHFHQVEPKRDLNHRPMED